VQSFTAHMPLHQPACSDLGEDAGVLYNSNLHCLHMQCGVHTHTHTRPFNGPLAGTTWVSRYQKCKTNLDLLEQETVSGSGISWAMYKSAPRS